MRELSKLTNCDVLLYEYPGYSLTRFTATSPKTKFRSSEKNVLLAAEAAFRFLVNDAGVTPSSIIIYGRSIGSGPSVHLASLKTLRGIPPESGPVNVAGLFLITPFLSTVRAVIGSKTAKCCFCYDKFPNHKKIARVKTHTAILHSRDDE